jgi:5-methylcytosine-specific restriction endonuclease McrA
MNLLSTSSKVPVLLTRLSWDFLFNMRNEKGQFIKGSKEGFQKGHKHSLKTLEKISKSKKGFKHLEETKRKISKANMGNKCSEETKKKISIGNKGKIRSEEHKKKLSKSHLGLKYPNRKSPPPFSMEYRKKLSEALKGRKLPPMTEEHKKNIGKGNKGKKISEECRKKMSETHKGEKSCLWKGGITFMNVKIRGGLDFRLWRERVFKRDNFTCQKCKIKGIHLHSHHIQNFSQFPELRFEVDNGITLCKDCHMEFHNLFERKNNNKEQLNRFLAL